METRVNESRRNEAIEAIGVLGDGFYRTSSLLRLVDDLPPSLRGELITLVRQRFDTVVDQVAAARAMLDQVE